MTPLVFAPTAMPVNHHAMVARAPVPAASFHPLMHVVSTDPQVDNGGAVLGMLLPRTNKNGQVLPADVTFALDADVILASLDAAGISAETTDTQAFMPPETLILQAVDNTVLVSCW